MKIFVLLLMLPLAACATLTADADQDITVTTMPEGAHCILSNSQQSVDLASTPGKVTVKRMFEPLEVLCQKEGAGAARVKIEGKTRGRAWGNALMFGVPALVDSSTGKGYEYDPDSVTLTLAPSAVPASLPTSAQ